MNGYLKSLPFKNILNFWQSISLDLFNNIFNDILFTHCSFKHTDSPIFNIVRKICLHTCKTDQIICNSWRRFSPISSPLILELTASSNPLVCDEPAPFVVLQLSAILYLPSWNALTVAIVLCLLFLIFTICSLTTATAAGLCPCQFCFLLCSSVGA